MSGNPYFKVSRNVEIGNAENLGGKSVSWPHVLFTSGLWGTSAETVHREGEEQKKYKR